MELQRDSCCSKLGLNVLHLLPNWLEITVDVHKEFLHRRQSLLWCCGRYFIYLLSTERVQTQLKLQWRTVNLMTWSSFAVRSSCDYWSGPSILAITNTEMWYVAPDTGSYLIMRNLINRFLSDVLVHVCPLIWFMWFFYICACVKKKKIMSCGAHLNWDTIIDNRKLQEEHFRVELGNILG